MAQHVTPPGTSEQDRIDSPADETRPPSVVRDNPGNAPTLPPSVAPDPAATQATLPPSVAPRADEATLVRETQVGHQISPPVKVDQPSFLPAWDRYEVLDCLGRGGMGEVYKARDRRLGRVVALKFLLGADPNLMLRMQQEAQAQARIDHPNICKVYEVGEVAGRCYIAMQYIDGQRLDAAAEAMSLGEKVAVMRDVALAIHEAHRLGVIHRDLKPANILVERRDGGRYAPVVMDFGLARMADAEQGLTLSGALLGTPAYMAPEQARGDLRSIDRRTDVYSLGATFYELLAGAPPFNHPVLAEALRQVMVEEPRSLRGVAGPIPRDLETIALKCLAKEPERRYPSARALAEDLDRHLDGEPILGRRPNWLQRLRRAARRQPAVFAVSTLSLIVIAVGGMLAWWNAHRERRVAEERTRLAARLGQDVKEIEWFLHSAYLLPLHDTSPEQARMRARMRAIAAVPHALGAGGEGALAYALGRGHLALHQYDDAARDLERARQAGLDTPELDYARGRVLGELYHRALTEARRSGDKAWLQATEKTLQVRYLQPARQALDRSRIRGLALESPEYLAALIAFYEGDYSGAKARALAAAQAAPWFYEARKLAAQTTRAAAEAALNRGDYQTARRMTDEALALFAETSAVARSDASVYEASAETWLQRYQIDRREGQPPGEALKQALANCDHALAAAPGQATPYIAKAFVLLHWYRTLALRPQIHDPIAFLSAWEAAAQRGVTLDAQAVGGWDALGNAHHSRALYDMRHGGDPEHWWSLAEQELHRATALQSNHPWAYNDLGVIHRWRGQYRSNHGLDPRPDYVAASRYYVRAAAADPGYLYARSNRIDIYGAIASYEASRGIDPSQAVADAHRAGEACLAVDGQYFQALDNIASAELIRALYLVDRGEDPTAALDQARVLLDRSQRINPRHLDLFYYRGCAAHLNARRVLATHPGAAGDARFAVASDQAERALGSALMLEPGCSPCLQERARLGLLQARAAVARGQTPVIHQRLLAALGDARRAVSSDPQDSDNYMVLSRIELTLAGYNHATQAATLLGEGLSHVDRALALNPYSAEAHIERGRICWALAAQTRLPARKAQLIADAQAAMRRGIALNPLLRREHGALLDQLDPLLHRSAASAKPAPPR